MVLPWYNAHMNPARVFFGAKESYLGVDLGTSSAKIVELTRGRKGIDLLTYAESNLQNLLVHPKEEEVKAIDETIAGLQAMMTKAGVVSKNVVAALPGGSVFSTVIMLPNIPDSEMEKAVTFAARDVVPADIDDMVIGWSKVGVESHMSTDRPQFKKEVSPVEVEAKQQIPVFVTAAPKEIVNRYITVFQRLNMTLLALEVETFPLVRSLFGSVPTSTLLIDIGSKVTTFHIIDKGIPRVSQSIDVGGYHLTKHTAEQDGKSEAEIEQAKIMHGILQEQDADIRTGIESSLLHQAEKAKELLTAYEQQEHHRIETSVLIGGGANLKGLPEYWSNYLGMQTVIGNSWKHITFEKKLAPMLESISPRYGVSIGSALRGFAQQ